MHPSRVDKWVSASAGKLTSDGWVSHSGGVEDSHPFNTTETGDKRRFQGLIRRLDFGKNEKKNWKRCWTVVLESINSCSCYLLLFLSSFLLLSTWSIIISISLSKSLQQARFCVVVCLSRLILNFKFQNCILIFKVFSLYSVISNLSYSLMQYIHYLWTAVKWHILKFT